MHHGKLIREGRLEDLLAIENQTEFIVENATPEFLDQLERQIISVNGRVVLRRKPQTSLEQLFLKVTETSTNELFFDRIGAIARTTFIELARLRVFYVLVLFALVLIICSSFIARISFQQELQVTRDIALGAINFFLSMLAIVATAQLLPRDLEDRVIYSVLAKPVRRFEYMMGKFFGVLGLLTISLIAMSVLCLAVIHLREGSAVRETMQQMTQSPPEELERALTELHQAGVNQDLVFAFCSP